MKTKKEDFVYCELIRIICFLYGGAFRGGIFRIPFPIYPKTRENCKNEAFFKNYVGFWKILFPLKYANQNVVSVRILLTAQYLKKLI